MDSERTARVAFTYLNAQRYPEAVAAFRQLLGETHLPDAEYNTWLEGLFSALRGVGHDRAAAYICLYLGQFERALSALGEQDLLDRARVSEHRGHPAVAAELYQRCGRPLLAAIAYERARKDPAARDCWLQARAVPRTRAGTYEEALLHFNLGYCCQRLQDPQGRELLATAMRLLEEAADELETAGLRERAFDCYQILLEMGRRSGVFENLSEGYLNCVRILKEDGLKFYVLQYYEDFLQAALQRQELLAAATLYQEVADYCLRVGLLYDRHYLRCAAEAWVQAALKNAAEGGAVERSENAYLAAIQCYNTLGDYHGVGQAYRALGQLDLPGRKRERYSGIARRYPAVALPREAEPALPAHMRERHAYPEIWYHDLVEVSHGGDLQAVCAQVLGDRGYPEVVRRRALSLLIDAMVEGDAAPEALAGLAERLGDLQVYVALSPLEVLYERGPDVVRRGVMRALRYLFFKRTFGLLQRGLRAEAPPVREEAVAALGRLHFRHAFDPLVRIFRDDPDPRVRSTALQSIGQILSLEAGDFLVEVLRQEPDPLRAQAKQLLIQFENRDLLPILRQQAEVASGQLRQDLQEVLQRLSG